MDSYGVGQTVVQTRTHRNLFSKDEKYIVYPFIDIIFVSHATLYTTSQHSILIRNVSMHINILLLLYLNSGSFCHIFSYCSLNTEPVTLGAEKSES